MFVLLFVLYEFNCSEDGINISLFLFDFDSCGRLVGSMIETCFMLDTSCS